jgi:hypothetical protein
LQERTFSKSTPTISFIPGKRNNATTEEKGEKKEKKTRKKKEKKTIRQREEPQEKRHGHKRRGRKEGISAHCVLRY